jgi:hypothetical protein
MYVSPKVRSDVLKNTPPNLGTRFFEHFDKRMCMYITGNFPFNKVGGPTANNLQAASTTTIEAIQKSLQSKPQQQCQKNGTFLNNTPHLKCRAPKLNGLPHYF